MGQLSRQELYDKIKKTSKDEYILSEMKRLGFWTGDDKPSLAEEHIKRKGELQQAINKLSREIKDPKAALKAIHKQRMAEARQRRIDTKVKKELKRYQRATAWYEKQQGTLYYLGDCCSLVYHSRPDDPHIKTKAQLEEKQLPSCSSTLELAEAMGVTLNELRFLCFTEEVSKRSHYQRFAIQKKTGGIREISAPMPRLKRLQYWILDNILQKIPLSEQAHGFVTGKSIVSNAAPHVGKTVVINLDLKDFFPSVDYPRIKGLFINQGYREEVAILLALLCSEPKTQTLEMDGQRYFIHERKRVLPQGAPTSPMISNLLCRRLDKRLQGLATKYGFVYTRYADDLSFSSDDKYGLNPLLHWVKATVQEEGFTLHPDKTRIMHRGSRQEVTGIVVNRHLSLNRKLLKQFRALLFQLQRDGYTTQHWGKGGDLLATITGFAHYVRMVKPKKGAQFLAQIDEIKKTHGYPKLPHDYKASYSTPDFRQASAKGELPLPNMQVAQKPPPPKIDDMLGELTQKSDVLNEIKARLIELSEKIEASDMGADAKTQEQLVNEYINSLKGLFGQLKAFLGGKA